MRSWPKLNVAYTGPGLRGGGGGVCRVWDREAGTELRRIGHDAGLDEVLLSSGGKRLLSTDLVSSFHVHISNCPSMPLS